MKSSVASRLAFVVLLCAVVGAPLAAQAMLCGQVAERVSPCIDYLKNGGNVPPSCCNGIRFLRNSAVTTSDRQTVCRCLVGAARTTSGIQFNLVAGLPIRCGVRLPYTISPSTNCDRIQ